MKNVHTSESLVALSRKDLISAALVAGIKSPYATKSTKLIDQIMKLQPVPNAAPVAEVEVIAPTAAETSATRAAPSVVAVLDEPESDAPVVEGFINDPVPEPTNVVAFEPAHEQTEIPVEAETPLSKTSSLGMFKVSRKVFIRQLQCVAKVTGAKATMPILNCALITFGNGRLKVEGTNLDSFIATEVPAETTGEHSLAVPFTVLSKFVARCSSDFMMAEVTSGMLKISDIENRTEIMGISSTEWPPMPALGEKPVMEITGKNLARVVTETIKCASADETRYILLGIAVALSKDNTRDDVVATDGRRLVRVPLCADKILSRPGVLIIPTLAAEAIRASVPLDATVTASLNDGGNRLSIASDANGHTYRGVFRLIAGNYPNYAQVIPKDRATTLVIDRVELLNTLGRMMVLNSEKANSVKLTITAGLLRINVLNVSIGTGKEEIKVAGGADLAEPLVTALNPIFLLDVVNSWTDDRITMSVKDDVSAVLVEAGDKLAVLMPVRLA
jgi:DNA polymerase-3 subunit beta